MGSTFFRRLRTYLIGVFLGSILVYFFFQDRLSLFTSWTPKNRVLTAIETSDWQMTQVDSCTFACLEIDPKDKQTLLKEASVLFSESKSEIDNPVRYYILGNESLQLNSVKVNFENDSLISFSNWKLDKVCPC